MTQSNNNNNSRFDQIDSRLDRLLTGLEETKASIDSLNVGLEQTRAIAVF
ncbi:MAG: hypothetical protein AB4372_08875 [Xenococcus sp. (in: cyanobacteria)]